MTHEAPSAYEEISARARLRPLSSRQTALSRRTAHLSRRIPLFLALLVAVLASVGPPPAPRAVALTPNTTYYFSNSSDCSGANAGTSPRLPMCSPAQLSNSRLLPGDRILLACGSVWRETSSARHEPFLELTGRGSPQRPIILGAYRGTSGEQTHCAARPRLIGAGGRSELIRIDNADNWRVSDLDLSAGAVGLRFHFSTPGHSAITLQNIEVHHFEGIYRGDCTSTPSVYTALGVLFDHAGMRLPRGGEAILSGINITGLEGHDNQGTLGLSGYGCSAVAPRSYLYRNIVLKDIDLHDDGGPSPACSDGMQLVAASDVLIIDSRFSHEGACRTASGTTGVILGQLKNVSFVNDIFARTPNTDSPDETAIDFENFTDDVKVMGSYIGENAGPGVEILTINGAENFHSNLALTSNLFTANSIAPFAATGEGGHIWRGGAGVEPTGRIADNLYERGTDLVKGSLPGVSVRHNVSGLDATHAAADFADSQWGAATSVDGRVWVAMRRSKNMFINTALTARVDRFTLAVTDCMDCLTARTWTAPHAGTISIRGVVLRTRGTSPGQDLAEISSDAGVLTRLHLPESMGPTSMSIDSVAVRRGETLRFSIALKDGEEVSWTPSIVFTE